MQFVKLILLTLNTFVSLIIMISCNTVEYEVNCKNIDSLSYHIGDTIYFTGRLKLTDTKLDNCIEGFNNYSIIPDCYNIPICVAKSPYEIIPTCLHNSFRKDGLRVKIVAKIIKPEVNVNLKCLLIELIKIEILINGG